MGEKEGGYKERGRGGTRGGGEENLESRDRAKRRGWEGGNLNNLVLRRGLHRLCTFDNYMGPRRAKDNVPMGEVTGRVKFGRRGRGQVGKAQKSKVSKKKNGLLMNPEGKESQALTSFRRMETVKFALNLGICEEFMEKVNFPMRKRRIRDVEKAEVLTQYGDV